MRPALVVASLVALVLAAGITACGESDAPTPTTGTARLTGENTTLRLDQKAAQQLTEAGVDLQPLGPATEEPEGIVLPISGGSIDRQTLRGTIEHLGGFDFSRRGDTFGLQDFVLDTTRGVLTATVGGAPVEIMKLDLRGLSATTEDGVSTTNEPIPGTLSAPAAAALGDAFGIDVLKAGQPFGELTVTATGDS